MNKTSRQQYSDKLLIQSLIKTKGFLNLHPILQEPFKKIVISTNTLYGKYINWDEVFDKLDNTNLFFSKEYSYKSAGSIGVYINYDSLDKKSKLNYSICINQKSNFFEAFTTLAHEFCHLLSVDTKSSGIFIDENEEKLNMGLHQKIEKYDSKLLIHNLGLALNEGMTDFISKSIIYLYYKDNPQKAIIAYNAFDAISCSTYNFFSKNTKTLYDRMGETLLYSYFSGNTQMAKAEFNRSLSPNSWDKYLQSLDEIYSMQFNYTSNQIMMLKQISNANLLKYCKSSLQSRHNYTSNPMLDNILKDIDIKSSNFKCDTVQKSKFSMFLQSNKLTTDLTKMSSRKLINMLAKQKPL